MNTEQSEAKFENIFQEAVALGIPHASHESDLYLPYNEKTRELVKKYNCAGPTTFKNQVEGGVWYDLPFQYQPFWDKAAESVERRSLLPALRSAYPDKNFEITYHPDDRRPQIALVVDNDLVTDFASVDCQEHFGITQEFAERIERYNAGPKKPGLRP